MFKSFNYFFSFWNRPDNAVLTPNGIVSHKFLSGVKSAYLKTLIIME